VANFGLRKSSLIQRFLDGAAERASLGLISHLGCLLSEQLILLLRELGILVVQERLVMDRNLLLLLLPGLRCGSAVTHPSIDAL
jgi:hypothetical protein